MPTSGKLGIETEFVIGRGSILVYGLPGAGKSMKVLSETVRICRFAPVIYAVPTIALRDYFARYVSESYGIDVHVVDAKDKCINVSAIRDNYRKAIRILYKKASTLVYKFGKYEISCVDILKKCKSIVTLSARLYSIIKTCSECTVKDCPINMNLKYLFMSKPGFYVMTHSMLRSILYIKDEVFTNSLVIIDEVDDYINYFVNVGSVVALTPVAKLAKVDPVWRKVYHRLKKCLVKLSGTSSLFYRPVLPKARLNVYVSATVDYYTLMICQRLSGLQYYYIITKYVPARIVDKCVKVSMRIIGGEDVDDTFQQNVRYVWLSEACRDIAEATAKLVDAGFTVGIACRSYLMNKKICEKLSEIGIGHVTDLHGGRPPRELTTARVVLWTTGGKWYRGISLPETNVIICTFQAGPMFGQSEQNIVPISYAVSSEIDEVDEGFIEYNCLARNVQSYFRTNRRRSVQHVFLFVDTRAHYAMCRIFYKYARNVRSIREWYSKELATTKNIVDTVQKATKLIIEGQA